MRTSSWHRYEQSDRVCLHKVHRAPVGLDSFDEAINPRYCRDVGFDGLYRDPQIGNVSDDFSITNAILLILTLLTTDIALSYVKRRWPRAAHVIDGVPTVLMPPCAVVECSGTTSWKRHEAKREQSRLIR